MTPTTPPDNGTDPGPSPEIGTCMYSANCTYIYITCAFIVLLIHKHYCTFLYAITSYLLCSTLCVCINVFSIQQD